MHTNRNYSEKSPQRSNDPLSLQQRDVRSDPKVVQEVSAATNSLLESLGALAVEVHKQTHTHILHYPHLV